MRNELPCHASTSGGDGVSGSRSEIFLGKRACLDVSSGEIGAQSPRAIARARDPMSPLDMSKHDLFPL